MDDEKYDVVVIGGGAAGLSGALTLARARRSVLVIDAGEPRNTPSAGVHGFLSRDGVAPAELAALGRAEVLSYGGQVRDARVDTAVRDGDGFTVGIDGGTQVRARRLLVATGLVDELPDVAGVRDRWGRDVLHCPYCHGWEVRDQPVGVLSTGPLGVHQAQLFRQWTEDVVLFVHTGPRPTDEEREQFDARGIGIVDGEVASLEIVDDAVTGVRLRSGDVHPRRAVVVGPRFTVASPVLAGLGVPVTEHPMGIGSHVAVDARGTTSVPGVWAAGNVADPIAQVMGAAAAGASAAGAINADLVAEDVARAVEARRNPFSAAAVAGRTPEQFWDDVYGQLDRMFSGSSNLFLVRQASDLAPGTALDLGCGEGADAIWLAVRGWWVTAVDVSGTALDRAAGDAREAGVAGRIDWQRHDLAESFPAGSFDLVSAGYLHSPPGLLPREKVLRAAVLAVAPGGVLLVGAHFGMPSWMTDPPPDLHLPSPEEVVESLDLDLGEWTVEPARFIEREQQGPDGVLGTRTDYVLTVRRRAL
ncbi:MAG: NAD(P)/FAD-dependent oxidoreductase [Pseudonocardia sp.]|nr:NAD(P)/FAD-dependent oxidoreductase [Pseudonocardia sp.]